MARRFLLIKIGKMSSREQGVSMGPSNEIVPRKTWGKRDTDCTLLAIATVNKHVSETSAVHEELFLRLNIIELRNSRGNLAIVVPPPSRSLTEADSEVILANIDDRLQAVAKPLCWGVERKG